MRYYHLLTVLAFAALTSSSCKEKGGRYIDQGEIHYSIDYKGNVGSIPKEILPKSMVISFKKDKTLFEMVSAFGNSGIINLSNPEKGFFDTYFSLFAIKYFYSSKPGELFPGFDQMEGLEIKKTSKTSVICGFNCKNAEVTFPNDRNKIYDIWYTNEINVKNSNTCTPYEKIDGVLMSFFLILGTSELHFDAETVYKKDIPDDTFDRKDKFTRVSKQELDKLINKMISL